MSSAAAPLPVSACGLRHVLVVGGSGFVGGAICRSALRRGLAVSSLSRSGCSPYDSGAGQHADWTRRVRWCKGDVLSADDQWRAVLDGSGTGTGTGTTDGASGAGSGPAIDAVVSCVGGFGSVAAMVRVNGAANIAVFEAASQRPHVRRIGFISAFHYQLPAWLQRGYMEGKLAAEAELAALLPSAPSEAAPGGLSRAAVVSQSGFLYGSRYVRSLHMHLPLQLIGAPLGWLTDNAVVRAIRQAPLVGPLLTLALLPPVSVDALGDAMIERLMDSALPAGVHTLTVEEIREQQKQQQHAKVA